MVLLSCAFVNGCATLGLLNKNLHTVSETTNKLNEVATQGSSVLLKWVIGLLVFLVVTVLFTLIRSMIVKRAKQILNTDDTEKFSWTKFKKIFNLGSGAEWAKSVKEILDLRKLVIYSIIAGTIFGYAYYKGRLNAPVKINMSYEKEWIMKINGEEIYKPQWSNDVYIRDSSTHQIIKQIKAKDMGLLKEKLKPIGFCFEPIIVGGYGVGDSDSSFEFGAGASLIKYWRWKLDAFLTNKGVYAGTHYQLTDNSGLGLGVGKGYNLDNRVIFYFSTKF